jgi:hypothetical protein
MLNFVYLRSSRLQLLHFWLDSCIVNKGEKFEHVLRYWMHLDGFRLFWAIFGLCCAPIWPVEVTSQIGQSAGSVHMLGTSLIGGVGRSDRSELSWCRCSISWSSSHAFIQGELHWLRGSLHVCRVGLFVFFKLWIGGLHSLLEHSFFSDVSSRCPCLRGPRLVFFNWSFSLPYFGFWSLVGVSIYSSIFFSFSLRLLYLCVVNTLITGVIEDHVWFEDRWMVASWCDEWLTTLGGVILS